MKISIVQFEAIKGNIEKSLKKHISFINAAIENKSDMIVFPELSLTGYEPELAKELATDQDDSRLDVLQKISDENNIIIGIGLPTKKENKFYISMIIFTPNSEKITYSKQYLYSTEVKIFSAEPNPLVIKTLDEVIAPAICYELSNEPHHKYAVDNKASIYIASVLNSFGGIEADLKKLSEIAKKYKMTTFMSNYIGVSGGYECAGKSSVWNKTGELICQMDTNNEGIIIFDTIKDKHDIILIENKK